MKAAMLKKMEGRIAGAFVLIILLLFSIYLQNAYAQTAADYINSGEQQLYTESIDGALEATPHLDRQGIYMKMTRLSMPT
ncbi:MAG: hypothetical protein P8185_22540 [Deltaproteobacteria bacterium]